MKREYQQLLLDKGWERLPRVLIASAECAPISKTGGLADVVGTLPKSLAALGLDARVITPYHHCVKEKYRDQVEHMFSFSVDLGWRSQYVGIEKLVLDGVTIYLVDNEYYFGDKIYRGGSAEAFPVDEKTAALAVRIAHILDLDYCGIDFLFGKEGLTVCEVNSNAFFLGFEKTTGVNVAKCYAEHVLRKLSVRG